jgi:hypothetical protein
MMADPTNAVDVLMGVGGGGAGTGVVGYGLYRIFGKSNSNGYPTEQSIDRLEGKMDQMVEAQQAGNLILAEIKGALGRTG